MEEEIMSQDYPVYSNVGAEKREMMQQIAFPKQHQQSPGLEYLMNPLPIFDYPGYVGSGRLKGKVALITGGDSGIGRAVAVAFAKEGAKLAIVYLNEHRDAEETKKYVAGLGTQCLLLPGDLRDSSTSTSAIAECIKMFGQVDIVVNNAAVQPYTGSIMNISDAQLENTFRTNVFSLFYMTKAALPYLKNGSCIINTTSRVAYEGEPKVIDYSATKGAIVSFTRTMAKSLAEQGIRVNAVAPGPIWTPLTVSTYPEEQVATLGTDILMGRAGQPFEIAPAYVYLAANDSTYVTGQVLHVNGGKILYT